MSIFSVAAARPAILAHQGGWDEMLLIAGPILLIAGLLVLAKRRVERSNDGQHGGTAAEPHPDGHGG